MRTASLVVAVSFVLAISFAAAQEKSAAKEKASSKMSHAKAELSDAQYTRLALSAAPSSIAKDAGVARMDKDGMKTLRESKNGFTCSVIVAATPMCADANSMSFFEAYSKHENPPDKLGLTYMLGGDKGASNTDPNAMHKTADNHWVVTGPHIMIVGPGSKSLGLSEAADADPTKPYMMWANTPYEHAMIPVGGGKSSAKTSTMAEKK